MITTMAVPLYHGGVSREWINQPLVIDPNLKTHDGYDMQHYCDRAYKPPLRQIRFLSSFACAQAGQSGHGINREDSRAL